MPDLISLYGWPLLCAMAAAAILIGFAKTSFGGLGTLSVAIFALAMPAKESTATVLLLLIVGDFVAVSRYRTVSWRLLLRLVPSVLPGLALGALFMNRVDDATMRRSIGGLLLAMLLLQLWQRRPRRSEGAAQQTKTPQPDAPAPPPNWPLSTAAGISAGFTTMTANAAGPIMALYFLAAKVEKARFIGTGAWFFLIINLTKTPIAAGLGLFTPAGLLLVALLTPCVLVGTAIGVKVIRVVTQRQFELVTIGASALAAAALLLR